MMKIFNCKKEKVRYIVSALWVMTILSVMWYFVQPFFETNDDSSLMYIMAGYRTGTPEAATSFCNYIFGFIVSTLYKIFPYFAWYTFMHLAIISVSCIIICKSILKILAFNSIPPKYGLFVYSVFYVLVLLYYSLALQFTVTPAFAGAAVLCLIYGLYKGETKRARVLDIILAVFLFFIAYVFRPASGLVVLAFALFLTCYKVIFFEREKKLILFTICLYFIVIFFSVHMIDRVKMQTMESANFVTYNSARSKFSDYKHKTFEENKEVYASVGWNQTLTTLAEKWFFMDRRINIDTFNVINQSNVEVSSDDSTQNNENKLIVLLKSNVPARLAFAAFIISSFFALVLLFHLNKKVFFWFSFLNTTVFFTIIFYLCASGRMPQRTFFLVYILAAAITMLIVLENIFKINCIYKFFCFVFFSALCLFFAINIFKIASTTSLERQKQYTIRNEVEQYVIKNSENIYIYDATLSLPTSPFTVYFQNEVPVNFIFWGGAGMHSSQYYKQLQANGLDELYSDNFLESRYYFATRKDEKHLLFDYMLEEYNALPKFVEEVAGVRIYKFLPH